MTKIKQDSSDKQSLSNLTFYIFIIIILNFILLI